VAQENADSSKPEYPVAPNRVFILDAIRRASPDAAASTLAPRLSELTIHMVSSCDGSDGFLPILAVHAAATGCALPTVVLMTSRFWPLHFQHNSLTSRELAARPD